jgi:hypothetical protein
MKHKYIIAIILLLTASVAYAADVADDMIIYRGGGSASIPEYRLRDSGGWESELTALDISGTIEYVKLISKPGLTATEKIACFADALNDVNCQVWNGSAWGNLLEVSSSNGGNMGFDLAYESDSGQGLVCVRTATDTQVPVCYTWNGTTWSSGFNATSTGAGIHTIRLISDQDSDYIAMMTRNSGNDINVQIWNGSSFNTIQNLTLTGATCGTCLSYDGAWEGTSGDFVAGWFDTNTDSLSSRHFDKISGWGSEITNVITGLGAGNTVWVDMASHPFTNDILIAVADGNNRLAANYWSNSSWGTFEVLAADINGTVSGANHLFDLAWEQRPDYDAIITYGSTESLLQYRIWDSGTSSWQAAVSLPTAVEAKDWHQTASDPNSQNIMLSTVGIENDVDTIEWNGSAWDADWTSHETASNDVNWNAWFAYDAEDENNDPPDVTVNSASQKTNGSGMVDVSVDIVDTGLHDVKLKVEFETNGDGECDGPWQNATLVGPATADYGATPDVDNGQAYQVGSGSGTQIATNSGANTITFDWDSKTDLPTGNSTYCLRFTANDGAQDTALPDTFTLIVDNVAPTGLANFVSYGVSDQTQHLNWTSASDTNFGHYEVWYGENQTDVEARNGTATEFDQDDYLALGTASTYHTHIMNLTPNTTYFYKLWAVDAYGNEQSSTNTVEKITTNTGNIFPTSSAATEISQATNGSGYVTFKTNIYDDDIEDVMMRVRFSTDGGTTFYNAKIVSGSANSGKTHSIGSADFQIGATDLIDIDNDEYHPVVLTVVWDSKSTENQNGGLNNLSTSVIIQTTPRDAKGDIGINYNSSSFILDNFSPSLSEITPVANETLDTTPDYVFSSTEIGTITYGGSCTSATANAAAGTNIIIFQPLSEGFHDNCTITVTDSHGNAGVLTISPFTVDSILTNETGPSGGSVSFSAKPDAPKPPTIEELIEKIKSLVAKILSINKSLEPVMNALLEKIDPSFKNAPQIRDLEFGMEGQDVVALQKILLAQGYSLPSGATGRFLWQTRRALAAYQLANGISPAVGMFGPVTRAKMKEVGLPGIWW